MFTSGLPRPLASLDSGCCRPRRTTIFADNAGGLLSIQADVLRAPVALRCCLLATALEEQLELSFSSHSCQQNNIVHLTGEDLDGPKTVEEKVGRLAKIRLMKQFSGGVIAYVVATALVVLLPIFVSPEQSTGEQVGVLAWPRSAMHLVCGDCSPGARATTRWVHHWRLLLPSICKRLHVNAAMQAVRAVLILQNIVLWLFMAGLAWIFRCDHSATFVSSDVLLMLCHFNHSIERQVTSVGHQVR